jgi:hypothetical protein
MESNYQVLLRKLDEFIRKYYRNEIIRGSMLGLAISLGFYLLIVLAEHFGRFSQGIRTTLFFSYTLLIAFTLGRFILLPALRYFRIGKIISHEDAARIIGSHFAEVKDSLLNTLQLREMAEKDHNRKDLILASIDQKISHIRPVPFTLAINLGKNRKYLRYLLPPLLILLLMLIASPSLVTQPTRRIVKYNAEFPKEFPFKIEVLNKNLRVAQDEDFTLKLKVSGEELPADIWIVNANGESFAAQSASRNEFSHIFRNLREKQVFRISTGDFISDEYSIEVLPKPVVLGFSITLHYPAYTGRKEEVLENSGDLSLPVGTRVVWNFLTRDADGLIVNVLGTEAKLNPGSGRSRLEHRFMRSGAYTVKAFNRFFENPDSLAFNVEVIPDAYPRISAEEFRDSLDSRRLYFRGIIEDDYGFSALQFHYRRLAAGGDSSTAWVKQPMSLDRSRSRSDFYHHLDLSQLLIQAGESYEYYFEVWDNDAVHGAKSSRSEKFVFKAPTLKEVERQTEVQNRELKNSMEQSIINAKKLQNEIDEFYRKVSEKKELGWQERKQLDNLIEKQQQLKTEVEELTKENLENNKNESMFKELDPEILEKQKELQKLMEELITGDLEKLLQELEKLMENLDKNLLNQALEKMKLGNEDLEKELDRNLELFRQLEFEKKLEDAIGNLEKLAEKQEKLAQESLEKEVSPEELEKKQKELDQEYEEFRKQMEEARKLNEKLEEPHELRDTKEQEQQIEQKMEEGSQMLKQNQPKKAGPKQKEAAGGMKKLAQDLRQMQDEMEMEETGEDIEAVRQLLENLVQVSFEQEKVMKEIQGIPKNDPRYVTLVQKQKKIHDDLGMIQDSLLALSKRNMMIQPVVNREINEIRMNTEKAIEALSMNRGLEVRNNNYIDEANRRQQLIMTSVNNLALLLDESLRAMQEQMNAKKSGKACKNPKKGGAGQGGSVKNMKQMQEALNKQIEAMKKGMEQGQKSFGGKTMSEQLARMAAEQEAIRKQMQDYINSLGKEAMGEKGNLSKMLEDMEKTERDLVNKVINTETIRRQNDILTRLLESEKAERERELDDKRESNEAKPFDPGNPKEFFEYKGLKSKESELMRTVPPMLRPYYKQKVNEYLFNN